METISCGAKHFEMDTKMSS